MDELSDLEEDMVAEVGNIGAGHAATALSDLLGVPVDMSIPSAGLLSISQLEDQFLDKKEDLFFGIYVPVLGDLEGGVLLMLSRKEALQLTDILMGREIGTTNKPSEMDESSLKEVGNILVGNTLTALSDFLEMSLEEQVPLIAADTPVSLMDAIAVEIGQKSDKSLQIEVAMGVEAENVEISFSFYLLFVEGDAERIIERVREKLATGL